MSGAPARTLDADESASFAEFVRAHADAVWRCLHALGLPPAAIDDGVALKAQRVWWHTPPPPHPPRQSA